MSPRNMTADPETVARNARRVNHQHEDHEHAVDSEEEAYATLLQSVLNAAVMALPAISSALPLSIDAHQFRGIVLVRGDDADVWWLESNELVSFKLGSTSQLTVGEISSFYGRQGVVDAIMAISVAIDAQLRGGKHKATEKILRRAEQIQAIATLARGIS